MTHPAPSSASRSLVCLRALVRAPALVAAFGFVAVHAGQATLLTDTLCGAEAIGGFVLRNEGFAGEVRR